MGAWGGGVGGEGCGVGGEGCDMGVVVKRKERISRK